MRPEDKIRLSIVNLKRDSKRPEVYLLQGALVQCGYDPKGVDGDFGSGCDAAVKLFQTEKGLLSDGIVGKGTWTALLRQARLAGFEPDLHRRVQSLVAWFEVDGFQNAYGQAEPDIGDHAGANYGVLQHNSLGSLVTVLKMGGRKDLADSYQAMKDKSGVYPAVQEWMGSSKGRAAQNRYFDEKVWKRAEDQLATIPEFRKWQNDALLHRYWERAMVLAVDTVTQNGGLWSGSRKPFWQSLTDDERRVAKYRELYFGERWDSLLGLWVSYESMKTAWFEWKKKCDGDVGRANVGACNELIQRIPDAERKLVLVAQWRARTSWEKYWTAVEARRMLDATGHGRVNGAQIELARDYGLGVDTADFEDRDGGRMETFLKDPDQDALDDSGR